MDENIKTKWIVISMIPLLLAAGGLETDNFSFMRTCMIVAVISMLTLVIVDAVLKKRLERSTKVYNYIKVRNLLLDMATHGFTVEECLACIYDLYQEGLITEKEEGRLYHTVDPRKKYNRVAEYWYSYSGNNPLLQLYKS